MSMLAKIEKRMMANSPQGHHVNQNQILTNPVFAMEKKMGRALVGLVRMVGFGAMLIEMPTVQISH